jgi:magnesium transporter
METVYIDKPWEKLRELVDAGAVFALRDYLEGMNPMDTALAVSRLDVHDQRRLLTMLAPEDAADVIGDISDEQAADLIEELAPDTAAAILEELDSDHVADLLGELDVDDVNAIIEHMEPDDAREARHLLAYEQDSAGGLMISEYLDFRESHTIGDVLQNMQANHEQYADYHVQYLYVTDDQRRLSGVLRLRDLLFPNRRATLASIMIKNPLKVTADATVEDLLNFFEEHQLVGVPVVDVGNRLVGVVLPEAVEEARRKSSVQQFLEVSGIIGGEEFRSMPLMRRSGRRLSWLSINIFLNMVAASVIALYQDTLAAAISLAVFLPIVSDMSGCSGNQAVAVSLRELSLGLVRTKELLRVLIKEASLGMVNGAALGTLLGGMAFFWKGSWVLGLVVGSALALNTIVAVSLGGLLPLVLKRFKLDPALVSSPVLTTVTDMCGFFFVLSLASLMLGRLA